MAPHFILPPNSFDLFTVFDAKAAENVQRLREQDSEIALLEQETLLLRTMQDRSDIRSAELEDAQVQQMHELAALKSEAVGLKCEVVGLKREIADLLPFRTDLQTLVFSLRWDDGPRALKLVLPLARIARRVMGGGARPASAPETVHHEAPDQTRP